MHHQINCHQDQECFMISLQWEPIILLHQRHLLQVSINTLLGTEYGLAKFIIFGNLHPKQINNKVTKTFVKIKKNKNNF